MPINDWSAQMASSIFDEGHRRLVELLIDARKKSGLKQAELGRRVGRSQSFISLIERSQRRVDVVEFIALSRAMNEDVEVIFKALLQAQAMSD
ncbi:helix-turn-helix transcriptional regulator [Caulobacter sp. UNC358MFTsu5.1]|uniref:helix-turn-helix transcriptional regulator n=1 Tax=Caulobacter sp. UNC358MFTsu5.1 TaxID=1449049 RepID=UPI001E405F5C|nr:helix-turn-helix transcriptional regulator [Caulobacter sp. UNC358MFTsu5.1]